MPEAPDGGHNTQLVAPNETAPPVEPVALPPPRAVPLADDAPPPPEAAPPPPPVLPAPLAVVPLAFVVVPFEVVVVLAPDAVAAVVAVVVAVVVPGLLVGLAVVLVPALFVVLDGLVEPEPPMDGRATG